MATREDVVVAAVDGSEAAKQAVRWAATTAHRRGVPLRLAASYATPRMFYSGDLIPQQEFFRDLEGEAQEKIEEARDIARQMAPDLDIEESVVEGGAIEMLLDISTHVTMIVMGSRGRGGLSGMVMGSVSMAVVSHASCPVVIVREDSHVGEDNKDGPVVVGADGSEVSRQAVEHAFAEADARGCDLVALRTWLDMPLRTSARGITAPQMSWDEVEREQAEQLDERLRPLTEKYADVPVTKKVARDRPVSALATEAESAQLLVVGSHGRGGFKGMLLGSTSRALLQFAPCPLMVVRGAGSR